MLQKPSKNNMQAAQSSQMTQVNDKLCCIPRQTHYDHSRKNIIIKTAEVNHPLQIEPSLKPTCSATPYSPSCMKAPNTD